MALVQVILLAPQPIYYFAGEIIKVSGDYSDLYYPNKWGFVWQLVFICILYAPSFGLYYMSRGMLKTCITRVHPSYDHGTHELYVIKKLDAKKSVVDQDEEH